MERDPVALEMGCSLQEFARALPAAMRDWRVAGGGGRWTVTDGAVQVATIAASPRPERVMAALRLPVLGVVVTLEDAARGPEFMRRFERGFRRGGG